MDSLRGIAALLVVADHTGMIPIVAVGMYGVLLFFTLSGYLLTLPFLEGNVSYTPRGVAGYLCRRVWRIVPMYIFYVAVAAVFYAYGWEWFLRHLVFYQADFHLWTVRQELLLYVMLPAIWLPVFFLRDQPLMQGAALAVMAIFSGFLFSDNLFEVTENQRYNRFLVAPFLDGMALACFMHWLRSHYPSFVFSPATCIMALGGLLLSLLLLGYFVHVVLWDYIWIVSIIYTLLLAVIQLMPDGSIRTLLQWPPLRSLGVTGYSFYLLHWLVKDIPALHSDYRVIYFLNVVVVTYLLSCITYCVIEKPGMRLGKRFGMRLAADVLTPKTV